MFSRMVRPNRSMASGSKAVVAVACDFTRSRAAGHGRLGVYESLVEQVVEIRNGVLHHLVQTLELFGSFRHFGLKGSQAAVDFEGVFGPICRASGTFDGVVASRGDRKTHVAPGSRDVSLGCCRFSRQPDKLIPAYVRTQPG